MTTNQSIARIFYGIADILQVTDTNKWKSIAYRRAARAIEGLTDDIEYVYKKGKLKDIPGVGEALAGKIEEFIKTGKIKKYDELIKKAPKNISMLMNIPGIGPSKTRALIQKLKIKNIEQLKKAALEHKIANLAGFGTKSEQDILKNLGSYGLEKDRHPLSEVSVIANSVVKKLKKYAKNIIVAGSIRRKKPLVRDIDILAVAKNSEKLIDAFAKLPVVKNVLAKGKTKVSVVLKSGIQADLRVVDEKSFGAALLYFTGSKEYNIALRRIAMKKGWKLNEYGLFKGNKMIAGKTEEEVIAKLGVKYLKPELRETTNFISQ